MPYKFATDKKKIPRALDRRVKLTEEDKAYIRKLYKDGNSIRQIARMFKDKCTRRPIQYTIFPARYEIMKKQFADRARTGMYRPTKAKWSETIREHRAYKQSIKNKLI